jgi:hypothetical protein
MEQSSGREPEYLITSRAVALSPLAAAVAVEALITLLAGAAVQLVGVLLIFPLQEADQAEFKGLVRDLGGGAAIAEMSLTVLVFLPAALVVIPLLWRDDQPLLSRWQVASLWGVTVTNGWQVLRGRLRWRWTGAPRCLLRTFPAQCSPWWFWPGWCGSFKRAASPTSHQLRSSFPATTPARGGPPQVQERCASVTRPVGPIPDRASLALGPPRPCLLPGGRAEFESPHPKLPRAPRALANEAGSRRGPAASWGG